MTRNSGYRIGSRALRPLLAAVVALALLAVAAPAPGAAPDSGRPGFAEYHGVRVSYFEYGPDAEHAPTVVVTGGWPWDSSSVETQAEKLAARGLHVVRYDQRGSGRSDHPAGVDAYGLPELAGEFGAVIDAAAPGHTVNVFGEAWGPFIASEYTTVEPGRISAIISVGAPSLDLAFAALYRQTRRAVTEPSLLVPVAAQWAAISYFFGLAIPQIPELIIGTGVPTAIVNTITDLTVGQMDKIRNDPASVFHGPVTVPDTGAGINKYRWFVYHRLAHPEHDYIDVPRLRLYQMSDDAVETDVLNEGLAERTPHLDKDTLPGDHGSYIAGPDAETILDGVRATIDQAPQR
ncbi:alpha/beta fold hydrolase [Nocardia brasiliensis]|uniref:alpha/beta fold hydrolase n=1 Tax=Nocardia brasiliensis TaxID=37326 RepID=UPI0009DD645A|nr:alpha/beta fold hydrolase [Nocardia brasiliensis]